MATPRDERVSDLGEIALVTRIMKRLGSPPASEVWAGDDTAVIDAPGSRLLFTVDTLVEDVDFDQTYARGDDIGFKALAVNVSDIASMGGRPARAVASLTLPPETPVAFVDDVISGLLDGAGRWDVDVVGGDLGEGKEVSLSVALIGTAAEPVLRSGARPGDALCVTGSLGGAAAGLAILRSGRVPSHPERALIRRHLRPEPRVAAGAILAESGCTAMIDISDGLAVDLWRLLESSGVGCEVDDTLVPVDPGLSACREVDDPLATAITGGEDFELLLTIGAEAAEGARRRVEGAGLKLTRIGVVTEGGRTLGERSVDEWRAEAWEHLSSS